MGRKRVRFCRRSSGFTLAELLIVVAVIAVLVAIAIPVFAQALERSRAGVCMANRRSLKSEMTVTLLTEPDSALVTGGKHSLSEALKSEYRCPDDGSITYTVDRTAGAVEVSCSIHSAKWSSDVMDKVASAFDYIFKNIGQVIDSTAEGQSTDYRAKAEKEFEKEGLDLEALGVKSWRISVQSGDRALQMTTADISTLDVGDSVLVFQYKPKYGYTVWSTKVKASDSGAYNILDDGNRTQLGTTSQDFDKIKDLYNSKAGEYGQETLN